MEKQKRDRKEPEEYQTYKFCDAKERFQHRWQLYGRNYA